MGPHPDSVTEAAMIPRIPDSYLAMLVRTEARYPSGLFRADLRKTQSERICSATL